MKILFCSPAPLDKKLGAARALMELAEEIGKLGWTSKIISIKDLAPIQESGQANTTSYDYGERLRNYLHQHAAEYDVVEYDHSYLPYPRREFCSGTLFVARSQLLGHHFKKITIPSRKTWKSRIRSLLLENADALQAQRNLQHAHTTIDEADIAIVLNQDDKIELIECGIPAKKIFVVANGLSQSRRTLFDAVPTVLPPERKIAFVGTFDNRKGATDFPKIVQNICDEVPTASFLLAGTAGLYRTKAEVLANFPRKLRDRLEVIPHFSPDDLPKILASCSVGIFPSYIEGFGLGVLEMLAASIPVIAYDSPGPPMMLPLEYLVPRGDTRSMSKKVVSLLRDQSKLSTARIWARQQSQQFCWQQIARQTSQIYAEQWEKKQVNAKLNTSNEAET